MIAMCLSKTKGEAAASETPREMHLALGTYGMNVAPQGY